MTIVVPTLDDNVSGYDWLFQTSANVSRATNVIFDFTGCYFLGPSAVAFLGGLARVHQGRGWNVHFLWNTLPTKVRNNLVQNGFLYAFGEPHPPRQGNSIPYREDPHQSPKAYVAYLEQMWLGKNWIRISDALRGAIVSRLCEGYLNVFDHANSPVGLFCCGQHFPKKHLLKLTLVDFGVGIPTNVRRHFKAKHDLDPQTLAGQSCMEWAFRRGTSTRPGGRGLGLDVLRSFVQLNDGHLEIFSNDGYAHVDNSGFAFGTRRVYFAGTLITILLRCDENSYCLASEVEPVF